MWVGVWRKRSRGYDTLRMLASLMSFVFLGGSCRRPFLGAAAALAACLAFEDEGLASRPLVLPWAMRLVGLLDTTRSG